MLFRSASLLDFHHGEKDSALANLLASIRLVRVNEEPLIISQLVRVAVGQIAAQGTWELIQHSGWSEAQLAQMQHAWQESDTTRGWLAAIQMERALGTFAFAEYRGNWSKFHELLETVGSGSGSSSSTPFFELLWDNPSEAAGQAGQLCVLVG